MQLFLHMKNLYAVMDNHEKYYRDLLAYDAKEDYVERYGKSYLKKLFCSRK